MTDAARTGAGFISEGALSALKVTGPDARAWLNGVLSCDVEPVALGVGAFGLALNKQGKILCEVSIVSDETALWLAVREETPGAIAKHLGQYLIMEDAELEDVSALTAFVALHGPRAEEFALRVAQSRQGVAVGRIDWALLGGALLRAPRSQLAEVEAALVGEGAERLSAPACDRLRVERLLPSFGVDYSSRDNVHEASLDRRAIAWKKGCYLGQEVVCMQEMRGKVKRRVVGLRVSGTALPAIGSPVYAGERQLGRLSTVAESELLGGSGGLALLDDPHLFGDVALTVGQGQGAVEAHIFTVPV